MFVPGDLREEPGAGKPHARICEGKAEWPSYSTYGPGGNHSHCLSVRSDGGVDAHEGRR